MFSSLPFSECRKGRDLRTILGTLGLNLISKGWGSGPENLSDVLELCVLAYWNRWSM